MSFGKAWKYPREAWAEQAIPQVLLALRELVTQVTGDDPNDYDIILLKVYPRSDVSLSHHQDYMYSHNETERPRTPTMI